MRSRDARPQCGSAAMLVAQGDCPIGEIMKIGIIGAGQIGGTLTRRLRALGHEVHVANSRDPRTLASLVTETGAVAVEAKEAPRGVDLVIVTIPVAAAGDLYRSR